MDHQIASRTCKSRLFLLLAALGLVVVLAAPTMNAEDKPSGDSVVPTIAIHATHVLGLPEIGHNAKGEVLVDNQNLRFQPPGKLAAQISLTSIQNIFVSEQDKQVGGIPMMLGKAAVPFGGGRVVSLFSHKKYDSIAIEYLDSSDGIHGVIFRVPKGEGKKLNSAILANRPASKWSDRAAALPTVERSVEARQWSVQVNRVDAGSTALDQAFADAIYENLIDQLRKSRQFDTVFRAGDRNAARAPQLLLLNMVMERYSPGSETRRAVTTVAGATKLTVRMQLVTADGHVVLERRVQRNVRFIGDNLNATKALAKNAARALQRSTLPPPSSLIPQQATAVGPETGP